LELSYHYLFKIRHPKYSDFPEGWLLGGSTPPRETKNQENEYEKEINYKQNINAYCGSFGIDGFIG